MSKQSSIKQDGIIKEASYDDYKATDFKVTETTRVGISKAKDTIARYYITDNPYVSKK